MSARRSAQRSRPMPRFAFSNDALARGRAAPGRRVPPTRPNRRTPTGRYPLRLLTLKRHYSINSSYGNLPVMLNAEPTATAEIHPDDAASASDRRRRGDLACTTTSAAIRLTASVTDNVPAGTIAVPFGRWGTDPDVGRSQLASPATLSATSPTARRSATTSSRSNSPDRPLANNGAHVVRSRLMAWLTCCARWWWDATGELGALRSALGRRGAAKDRSSCSWARPE